MTLANIPNPEALIEILQAEGAPPRITLDIGNSDFDGDGTITVALDADGHLVEV